MKRVVFFVSTACTLVLGLEKIGGSPIAPGFDTRLEAKFEQTSQGNPLLRITTDAGDLECRVQLRVSGLAGADRELAFHPRITRSGLPMVELAYRVGESGTGWADLEIGTRDLEDREDAKFLWPAGRALEVLIASARPDQIILEDWHVYLSEGESDSRSKALRRRLWFWSSLTLLGLSLATALYTGMPRREQRGDPLQECLKTLVSQIEGKSEEETRGMQELLRRVVFDGAGFKEALEGLRNRSSSQRSVLWLQARSRFLQRLEELILKLRSELTRLRSRDG